MMQWGPALLAVLSVLLAAPTSAADSQHFDSAGVSIRYLSAGEGQPIVLLHGFSGSAETAWVNSGVFDALVDAGYRVIAMDHRGHGESDKPHDPDAYGGNMAEDVRRLLDSLAIDKAHIVGYSMGAKIANTFRDRHPQRFITLTLGGYGWPWRSAEVSLEESRASMSQRFIMPGNDLDALAASRVRSNELVPDAESLRTNDVPALSLVGTEDVAVSRGNVATLRETMSNLLAIDMPGTHAGKDGALYKPQFAAEVISFIRKSDE